MKTPFKQIINESFEKTFNYRIKFAGDISNEGIKQLENILGKYGVESVSSAKRTPIQDEPLDFKYKKLKGPSEVTSVDVVLKYPINEKLLEVWVAVNMQMLSEYVVVQPVDSPRTLEDDVTKNRIENDKDRYADMENAELTKEEQEHYEIENQNLDFDAMGLYGEDYNEKFIAELMKIRDEKGAEYFNHEYGRYPSKSMMMGDDLKPLADAVGLAHDPSVQGNEYPINQGPVVQ